ncbi:hypothetical protein ACFSC6_12120 [Rufibacter sediminis]|uniref:Phage protein n=1 Tax=Rufibacter sediminis TaxID=2762756 RepID=A0ABR6VU04_9BACT|nr:hypothetical protein [Rufibacter sediminis]MBC3540629.1 hypothetical protein [Rufibacter sediminis]
MKASLQFWNNAQNAYEGQIPCRIREEYETMRAKENETDSPAMQRIKYDLKQAFKGMQNSSDAAAKHFELGNTRYAISCVKSVEYYAEQIQKLELILAELELDEKCQ